MTTVNDKQREIVGAAWSEYLANPTKRLWLELLTALQPVMFTCQKGMSLAVIESGRPYMGRFHGRMILALMTCLFRRFAVPNNSPQYNDYLMAKWELTRNRTLVSEMYHRAAHSMGLALEVKASCQWMVESVSRSNPKFEEDLKAVVDELVPDYLKRGAEA